MKILIFGANGQVGHELRSALKLGLQSGHNQFQIICSTRSTADLVHTPSIWDFLTQVSPDVIVNASAYTAVDKAESEVNLAYLINEAAVKEMALFCKINKSSLIHISTDYVFDGNQEGVYVESDAVCPSGVYGSSKLAGENAIREILDEHIILRTSWVFGVSGTNFVKTMLRLGKENEELGVVADQYGAPTSARAIAKTIAGIVDHIMSELESDQIWGTYHYSGFPFVSWAEFAKEIFEQAADRELMSVPPTVNDIGTADYPTPAARPANSRLDCSKLKSTFGIEPDDWKTSLGLVLDELKEGMQN
jgi:dTDP-4-dehydrorhamnose reductase